MYIIGHEEYTLIANEMTGAVRMVYLYKFGVNDDNHSREDSSRQL